MRISRSGLRRSARSTLSSHSPTRRPLWCPEAHDGRGASLCEHGRVLQRLQGSAARGLRAAKPPVGGSRLRAQRRQPGVHHRRQWGTQFTLRRRHRVSSKRSGRGGADWRNWFEPRIEIRFAQSIARYTPRADPADFGEIVARRGSQSFRPTHSKRRPRTVAQTVAVRFPFVSKKLASVVPVSSSGSIPISNAFVSLCVAVQTPAGLNRKTIVTAVNS